MLAVINPLFSCMSHAAEAHPGAHPLSPPAPPQLQRSEGDNGPFRPGQPNPTLRAPPGPAGAVGPRRGTVHQAQGGAGRRAARRAPPLGKKGAEGARGSLRLVSVKEQGIKGQRGGAAEDCPLRTSEAWAPFCW